MSSRENIEKLLTMSAEERNKLKTVQFSWHPVELGFVKGADIIGINTFHTTIANLPEIQDRLVGWLQIHLESDLEKEGPIHDRWLREEHPFPIYMVRKFERFPASVALPKEDLDRLWVLDDYPSFHSSFDYGVALAVHLGYERVIFENINLVSQREAFLEAPSFIMWAMQATLYHGVYVDFTGSRLYEKANYGFESRGIPLWFTEDQAEELIVDYVNAEARRWLQGWKLARRKVWSDGVDMPVHYAHIPKEKASEYVDAYYEMIQNRLDNPDEMDTY